MIKSRTVQGDDELLRLVRAVGGMGSIYKMIQNSSGYWLVLYEDTADAAQLIIRGGPRLVGFSYGAKSNIDSAALPAAQLVRLAALRTTVTNEAVDSGGHQTITGTLAQTYVTPGSVVITDAGDTAFVAVDNGEGLLVNRENTKQEVGTLVYSTGDYSIRYPALKIPSGAVTATYSYSTLPDSSAFPAACEVRRLAIKMTGGSATSISYELFEDEAMAHPAVASGTLSIASGETKHVDLNILTHTKDLTDREARWLRIDPNSNNDSDYLVHAYWKTDSVS